MISNDRSRNYRRSVIRYDFKDIFDKNRASLCHLGIVPVCTSMSELKPSNWLYMELLRFSAQDILSPIKV